MSFKTIVTKKTIKIVRNLRRRILKATKTGDFKRVRGLTKLLLKNYAQTLLKFQQLKENLRSALRKYRSGDIELLIAALNRILTSSRGSQNPRVLDHWLHHKLLKVAKRRHPNKTWGWCKRKYFGRFDSARGDKWVFGNYESGNYVVKLSW
ncbi:reverse transcriptase N-terminal domain-containing protein [Gloeocapsa sp. PCC 73106]|uniref:reverse transcriptase N-terminal domain-containing protein n=1 Tax=Gloeocapsa sp. PCC 73106 TaxID=102232 RepID=UPI0002AC277C|nr:reverse transcriptase N-terminal domain-containing protein [Gloeocapsa sp. PCC 73106]ELR97630.1 group II intron maturase family protein [Gloeocapsa sp. PCC 73106]